MWRLLTASLLTGTLSLSAANLASYAKIAREAMKSVVNIRSKHYTPRKDPQDLYQFFLNGHLPRKNDLAALGSGVVISADGYIVTNYHLIQGTKDIQILLPNRRQLSTATLSGIDRKTNLALLKISPKDLSLQPLSLGDSDPLQIGDLVFTIGNPFGHSHIVTSGIISSKGKVIGSGEHDSLLQTDATIHPGNYGGALIDSRGRAIGINTTTKNGIKDIGFVIPINTVKTIIADLKRHGKVIRPWLGIVAKNVLSVENSINMDDPTGAYGVLINNIIVGSPAASTQLKIGDLLRGVDTQKIFDIHELNQILLEKKPTEKMKLKIYRRGKGSLEVDVSLQERPKSSQIPEGVNIL